MRGRSRIGDYEVIELGVTTGLVRYGGTHMVLPRKAIIEVADPAARTAAVRLLRQACLLEAMDHRGIPRVFECGMVDGAPWVAFEALHGVALAEEMLQRRFAVDEVIDLVACVAAILSHAHARGVLHRDITPVTIARHRERGMWVLTGWDSACTLDAELAPPLRSSPRYHAPELAVDGEPDPGSDVFALAMIAYEVLTGDVATLPVAEVPYMPPPLGRLLAAMLSSDPQARPAATEVWAAVQAHPHTRRAPRWTPPWPLEKRELVPEPDELTPARDSPRE